MPDDDEDGEDEDGADEDEDDDEGVGGSDAWGVVVVDGAAGAPDEEGLAAVAAELVEVW
ncbi:hypothetical protein [Microlunatus antarcticus]|uniref:Uncharacterized protein n=1 Tax=Microlunatus antarcticus TaxID=53388 RepID=A0A7W5JYD0_9ACTN|nr:hypothetical protein [Microlunatus antarcticus]